MHQQRDEEDDERTALLENWLAVIQTGEKHQLFSHSTGHDSRKKEHSHLATIPV
jgi:hypothetical protein